MEIEILLSSDVLGNESYQKLQQVDLFTTFIGDLLQLVHLVFDSKTS
jgi:hypothetical protein